MMSGLCEYEPYKIHVSVSSSLPAVEGKVGFVRSLHMSVLKIEALWLGMLLNDGEGKGCFGSICCPAQGSPSLVVKLSDNEFASATEAYAKSACRQEKFCHLYCS
jgi:hypothetical protein